MFMHIFGILAVMSLLVLTGCTAVEAVADSLDDKSLEGVICVQKVAVTSSDAVANGSPTMKVISIVGDVNGIPVRAKEKEQLKDYCKVIVTETPGFFDFTSKKREVKIWFTTSSSANLQANMPAVMTAAVSLFSGKSQDVVSSEIASWVQAALTAATRDAVLKPVK